MSQLKNLCVTICIPIFILLSVLALMSCKSPTATLTPTIALTPTLMPRPTDTQTFYLDRQFIGLRGRQNPLGSGSATDACDKDIIQINLVEATRNAPADQPILWTFGVNFDMWSRGNPIGCFKLYHRDTSNKASQFAPLTNAKFGVDSCSVHGSVQPGRKSATFRGGYISCVINLSQWIELVTPQIVKYNDQPHLGQELISFFWVYGQEDLRHSHVYTNFTMVASVLPSETISFSIPLSIISYAPVDPSFESPSLTLTALDMSGPPFSILIDFCGLVQFDEAVLWWYDLHLGDQGLPFQYLFYRDNDNEDIQCESPSYIDQSLKPPFPRGQSLDFWIDEATLYIGGTPDSPDRFHGIVDGVLVDPTDSKPGRD